MIPNMRFYVVSIVSIFLALAIGIYIGSIINANEMIVEQKEDIVTKLEENFDYLKEENSNLKKEAENLKLENDRYKMFSDMVYPDVIKNRLVGANVAIIETNDDYIYSGIGKTLETAGANVKEVITIKDRFLNNELVKEIYANGEYEEDEREINKDAINYGIRDLTNSIISGEKSRAVDEFKEKSLINLVGEIKEPIDYIIIAGGSESKDLERFNYLDKNIIDICKSSDIPVIGIEKTKVKFSYTDEFKNYRVSTVDNVDTAIGKVALILSMEGRPGYYGVKSNAENLLPNINNPVFEWGEFRWKIMVY